MDDGPACGRPFQDAAAVLVDPEDEPDGVDDFDPDPESEDDEEDDDVEDEDSLFFSPEPEPEPLDPFEPLSFEPSFADAPFDDPDLAGSRLSLR
ncbi:MAG TPA: hypothetical protein VLM05_15155 [Mycobacteriales bacterium]|nr:hypothetical protein [Mycobacteriales bacterium]